MSDIVKRILDAQDDQGINVLNLGPVINFENIKKEALNIIESKPGTTVITKDIKDHYREDDYIINVDSHPKLHDQLDGGYRSFQLFRPEPGWLDIYPGLKEDIDYTKWKFWAVHEYPNISKFLKTLPSCFNFGLAVFFPNSRLTVHREPVLKKYRDKWLMICRFHVPLTTNKDCSNYVGNGLYHLDEGKTYFVNIASKHDGRNDSLLPRYHLLYDLVLTEKVIEDLKKAEESLPYSVFDLDINPNRNIRSIGGPVYIPKENPFLEI